MNTVTEALAWALKRIETARLGEGEYFGRASVILEQARQAERTAPALLADRLRGGSECAPWVVDEVRRLECALQVARLPPLVDHFPEPRLHVDLMRQERGSYQAPTRISDHTPPREFAKPETVPCFDINPGPWLSLGDTIEMIFGCEKLGAVVPLVRVIVSKTVPRDTLEFWQGGKRAAVIRGIQ